LYRFEPVQRTQATTACVRTRSAEGAADKALIELLAETCGVYRTQVELISGRTSRRKIVRVHTADPGVTAERLRAALK